VPLANLNEVSLPVFTESELSTDWVEAALDAAEDAEGATVVEAERAFHAYLDEDDRRRRKRLQQPHLHADPPARVPPGDFAAVPECFGLSVARPAGSPAHQVPPRVASYANFYPARSR